MKTIMELESARCTGCAACAQRCPRTCIEMRRDAEGFLYPVICRDSCVQCGLCYSVCPVINPHNSTHAPTAYAVKCTDEEIRANSSSGGAFTLLAEYVLDAGGVVFGAGFDETLNVVHTAVETKTSLGRLRGSKYVQSDIGTAYEQAKQYLDSGRMVYFSGTPCQIEGLLNFLGRPYERLITQDLVCHGVPSPMVWRRYLQAMQKKYRASAKKINFRYKVPSWRRYGLQMEFSDGGQRVNPRADDFYMRSFLADLCLRPSCYSCTFKKMNRACDFTLADFWGIQNYLPELDDDKGTSLVVCHTPKALALFERIQNRLICAPASLSDAVKHNTAMIQSAQRPAMREAFMLQIQKKPFFDVARKFCKRISLPERAARKIWRTIKRLQTVAFKKFGNKDSK